MVDDGLGRQGARGLETSEKSILVYLRQKVGGDQILLEALRDQRGEKRPEADARNLPFALKV